MLQSSRFHSVSPVSLISIILYRWVHLPVQMAVIMQVKGGGWEGVKDLGEGKSMQEHYPDSLIISLISDPVHPAGLY